MEGPWTPHETAGGLVRVWLPEGERLEHYGGLAQWSVGAGEGRFTVASAESGGDGDGDALLAAERDNGGEVEIERDERDERGGLEIRRLRYRSRRRAPRVVVDAGGGHRTDAGGDVAETLADFLLFHADGRLVRVGYAIDGSASDAVRAALTEVLERTEIGDEAR